MVSRAPLVFVHIPKCGGCFVGSVLAKLGAARVDRLNSADPGNVPGIVDLGHRPLSALTSAQQAKLASHETWTVVRHPVARLESLLNYRLDEAERAWKARGPAAYRGDWPQRLKSAPPARVDVDGLVKAMTDDELRAFRPYRTLKHYARGCKHKILIADLGRFLAHKGYPTDVSSFPRRNCSTRVRGELSPESKARIARVYADDVMFYERALAGPKPWDVS